MRTKTKAFITNENTITDIKTGEVLKSETTRSTYTDVEPPYIKMYLEDLSKLHNLPNNSSDVLIEFLKLMSYEGLIVLNSTVKKMIQERVGYKNIASLDNYLTELCKTEVFTRSGRGVYKPNPYLFGRGDWKSISKHRDGWVVVDYNEKGERCVKSSLSEEDIQAQKAL